MTTEAALAKLSFLLARKYDINKIKMFLQHNLHGELTVVSASPHTLRDNELLRGVAEALHISSSKVLPLYCIMDAGTHQGPNVQEMKRLKQVLFAPLMCAAAAVGDIASLKALYQQKGDFNLSDYDSRTPLHLASCEGHVDTVRYLLEHGASVHVCDRFNHTPLQNACSFG
jgi:lysophospholipase